MNRTAAAALALALSTPAEAQERPSVAPKNMQAFAPGLADYTDDILFGDIWLRPDLSPRDRSLVTLSVLIATGKTAQIGGHLGRGLTNGITPGEIAGMVTHLAFYTGWPNAVSALNEIAKVYTERKIDSTSLAPVLRQQAAMPDMDSRASAKNDDIAVVSPKFAALTDTVIFGDLWRRTDLRPRDRSLVTIAALASGGDTEELAVHIRLGLENGLTKAEIGEAINHLSFYAGWPRARAAIGVAAEVFRKKPTNTTPDTVQVTPSGQNPTAGPAAHFTGSVTVTSPFTAAGSPQFGGASVTFQAGARTNWHSHPSGQLLIVTMGQGWVQAEGQPVRAIKAGDVVWTGPGVKHWHGATRTTSMTHVAVAQTSEGKTVTWMEPVTDEQFRFPA